MTRYGLVLALLMLAAIFAAPAPVPPASANASRWGSTYLPNVTVITQDNRPVQFYDDLIRGQTVVIIFIYTSCKSICPLILARIADLQKKLDKDVVAATRFIAISIDPIPDT